MTGSAQTATATAGSSSRGVAKGGGHALLRPRGVLITLGLAAVLLLLAQWNFLFTHVLVEFWSIVVAFLIFVFTRKTRRVAPDAALEFLGVAYAGVAVIDFFHTLTYSGMNVFPSIRGPNVPTQLWVVARLLQAASLLLAPWLAKRRGPRAPVVAAVAGLVAAALAAILALGAFPDCYVEGVGLTSFKVGSEVVVCLLLLGALYSLYRQRRVLGAGVRADLSLSVVLTIVAEGFFMLYRDVHGMTNTAGHLFKGLSFVFIYRLVVRQGLIEPLRFRRQAERELREKDRRLHLAMEGARVGFWEWQCEDDALIMNRRWFRFFAYGPAQVPTTMAAFRGLLHPADVATVDMLLAEHAAGKALFAEFDARLRTASGTWRWIQARGYAVESDLTGKPLRLVGFFQDIHQRREAELQAEGLRSELARASRIATLGQLTAALAHEINQPLAAIAANAKAALRLLRRDPVPVPEVTEALEDVARDAMRAGDVVRRLRELLHKGKSGTPVPLDVVRLVTDVLVLAEPDLRRRHVAPRMAVAPGLPAIDGDRVQLQQVLLNLVLNAADALEREPPRDVPAALAIGAEAEGDAVRLTVRDNGPGIDPSEGERVFEPFHTIREDGLGMGLAISRAIVEAHGGRLWWTANPDRGVTFHFTVGIAPAAAPDPRGYTLTSA